MKPSKQLFNYEPPVIDLRLVITRHGERADLALGPGWYTRYQRTGIFDPRISRLTTRRPDPQEWNYDPPLTVRGEQQARAVGRKLLQLGCSIDYCYSSPSYRSIQTANRILEGQGRKIIPINVEPGLFECPSWYANSPLAFVPVEYLAMDRNFNLDPYYQPVYGEVNPVENEKGYYKRSRRLVDAIVEAHESQPATILLSGHAGSIEAITRGLLGRRARPEQLQYEADKVNYCNFAILERDAQTKIWYPRPVPGQEPYYGMEYNIPNTIPLYRATSQFIQTNRLRGPVFPPKYYPYGDPSYRPYRYQ